jgi:ribose 1,5-bisphosphate isomerase
LERGKIEKVKEAAGRIRRLEVQGATSVAITAVLTLTELLKTSDFIDRESIISKISEANEILIKSRSTEPFMRNALRYMGWEIKKSKWNKKEEFINLISNISEKILKDISDSRETITNIGSKRIVNNYRILTHCHSSAVTSILKKAKQEGVNFQVICTESRPVYQGRITARELLEVDIETTMIVDSAVRSFLNKVDIVLVGADAITSEGNVINKIGTSQIALMAHEARTPFYVVAELLKFDPKTVHGEYETIEERHSSEIWLDAPKGLTIRNPAFDVTRRDYIHGIICEEGIISPHSILQAVKIKYPWILELKS